MDKKIDVGSRVILKKDFLTTKQRTIPRGTRGQISRKYSKGEMGANSDFFSVVFSLRQGDEREEKVIAHCPANQLEPAPIEKKPQPKFPDRKKG